MNAIAVAIATMVQNTFNFTIDKLPLSGPDNLRTPFFGLFRSDNGQAVGGAVSKVYVPHQTEDIIALAEAAAIAFDGVGDVECYFNNGHYLTISPTAEYRRAIFGTKDNIFARVVIKAGYDGRAFRASMGYFRDACKNLHILRMVSGTSVYIRHTSGLRTKMDELVRNFATLRDSWNVVAKTAEKLQATPVDLPAYLTQVFGNEPAEAGRAQTLYRQRLAAVAERIARERTQTWRVEGSPVSAWEALNGVQGYIQHDTRRRGQLASFGRIIAAQNDPLVVRAERVALELAA